MSVSVKLRLDFQNLGGKISFIGPGLYIYLPSDLSQKEK